MALQKYASIELLLFQHKTEQAKTRIDSMLFTYPNHSLTDELLWLKSDILKKEGQFEKAIAELQKIVDDFGDDILSDDAYFSIADILDRHLSRKDEAMELYRNFLTKYPGSVYVAESRKRFRELRGDFDSVNQLVN